MQFVSTPLANELYVYDVMTVCYCLYVGRFDCMCSSLADVAVKYTTWFNSVVSLLIYTLRRLDGPVFLQKNRITVRIVHNCAVLVHLLDHPVLFS